MDSQQPEAVSSGASLRQQLRSLVAALLALLETRLELFCTELEEEREHLLQFLLFGLISVFFISLGVIVLTFYIIVYFWETHRLLAIGLCSLFYFLVGCWAAAKAQFALNNKPRFLDATLTEIRKDAEKFKEAP